MTIALEEIVRPYVVIDTSPPELDPADPVTDLETLPAAYIEWGVAAEFVDPGPGIITSESDVTHIIIPGQIPHSDILRDFEEQVEEQTGEEEPGEEGEEEEPEKLQPALVFKEIKRTTSTIRVTNPQDAEQYVDVERIETITFRGPDGIDRQFVLRHGGA